MAIADKQQSTSRRFISQDIWKTSCVSVGLSVLSFSSSLSQFLKK